MSDPNPTSSTRPPLPQSMSPDSPSPSPSPSPSCLALSCCFSTKPRHFLQPVSPDSPSPLSSWLPKFHDSIFSSCLGRTHRQKIINLPRISSLPRSGTTPPSIVLGFSKSEFRYEELVEATDNFSAANLLGEGAFGKVHKGILPNGTLVAVKRLKPGSSQGDREFQAEIQMVTTVHHKHLVSLIGYCISGGERILVYELVPNSSLEKHLHGKVELTLEWRKRFHIVVGCAKGLEYLHEYCHPKIIHRDIKASNILLDSNFEAKVGDFGLAKFTSDANSQFSSKVVGTHGYIAPEYATNGISTDKSDVFSFGVVALELITGRKPLDSYRNSLVDWARPRLRKARKDGNFDTLVDPKLLSAYDRNEMARIISCAAACVHRLAERRPSMSQVVRALEGNVGSSNLNQGTQPGPNSASSSGGSDRDESQSIEFSGHFGSDPDTAQDIQNFEKLREMTFETEEFEPVTSFILRVQIASEGRER